MISTDRPQSVVISRQVLLRGERLALVARRDELILTHRRIFRETQEGLEHLERMRAAGEAAALQLELPQTSSALVLPVQTIEALTVFVNASMSMRLVRAVLAKLNREHLLLGYEAADVDARIAWIDAELAPVARGAAEQPGRSPERAMSAFRN